MDYVMDIVSKAVLDGNLNFIKQFLDGRPEAVTAQDPDGYTILHMAVIAGHVEIVKELVGLMSEKDLEIQEKTGSTALFLAAASGFTQIAQCMIEKNEKLVSIATHRIGHIPVVEASINGYTETVRYLYTATPLEELTLEKGKNGATLLSYCISGKLFDIALDLLHRCPRLAIALDIDGNSPVFILSRMPSVFPSGSPLVFWQRWIYSCICVQPTVASDHIPISIQKPHQGLTHRGCLLIPVCNYISSREDFQPRIWA
ncbi:hypothetical protein L1049_012116 [Liquidambar formosana]|uniref:Uncharacterized protein n=1 Tax=Liquidambar formosana TaxID=63359 RepID=A0AAP0RYI5_LIQFO